MSPPADSRREPARLRTLPRLLLACDAARRLGPHAVGHYALHRLGLASGLAVRALRNAPAAAGSFLPAGGPAPPPIPAWHRAAILAAAARLEARPDWHGPFPAGTHALRLDLFGAGDIRPVWERNRLAALPLLAQAARLDPEGGHRDRAEALLRDWSDRNRPFRGPNWACGQEAALRALHLALALALLQADRDPPAGARTFLGLHARRILATPHYALAQDNNHPVSEAAGLLGCGLLLRDAELARRGAGWLDAAVRRLVAPDGAFAAPSPGYHRLLLDTLAIVEWLRRRHAGPPAGRILADRARAATLWLHRVADPATGALPRIGHCDDSAFADLSLCGPGDARGSLERAARLFATASAGLAQEPGCLWLGLPAGGPLPQVPSTWQGEGWAGFNTAGASALLRTGAPLRFRPAHADLLHLDLRDGPLALLRDGGTGVYNPPPDLAGPVAFLASTAAHNTVEFDGGDQMPRLSRFLHALWPQTEVLRDGAAIRDHRGNRHARMVRAQGRLWQVEDRVEGPFRRLALRWRLAPGEWRAAAHGVEGPLARIAVRADAPLDLALVEGWESPAYGELRRVPVLEARAAAPVSHLLTSIRLP
jgi:hypothetical protein